MQVGEEGQGNYGQTITLKRKEKKIRKQKCVWVDATQHKGINETKSNI